MPLTLYSAASVDALLGNKLSDAPSDGSTYGRKDGTWEVVSGGGGWTPGSGDLDLGGYSLINGNISITSGYVSTLNLNLASSGSITFGDSTVQTTAATSGVNLGDVFSIGNVQDVTFAGSYPAPGAWTITFRPVNTYIANGMTLVVENGDGTISQDVKGAVSTVSPWTYTTTWDTFPADQYLFIVANGIKSTIPINFT
jgi:hypothetical protein